MVTNVGGIAYTVELDTSQMDKAEKDAIRKLGRIGDEGDKLKTRFTAVATAITAALSAIAIEGLVSKIVTAQRQFDVLFSSLRTVTGGIDQASAAWERLTQFAATTPYTLDQTVQGFVKLKALGLDPSERAMTSFGNTASAMGKDLMQMIEAVADASTGEFERLKEFGIKASKEGDSVSFTFQGVTTTVKNSAAEITEYLTKIGEVNFDGAMSVRMETLDGAMSNLEDAWASLYRTISQSGVGDLIADMVRGATTAIQELTLSIESGSLTEYFDKLRVALVAAEVVVVSLAGAMTARLITAMAATVTQAYATATAVNAASVAGQTFSAVVAGLGGPIGIAVTALSLLVINWDKVAGSALSAAEVSERSAERIAKALGKSSQAAQRDLANQLKEAEAGLKEAEQSRARVSSTVYKKEAKSADLAAIDERINAYKQAITDIKVAMGTVDAKAGGAGGGRGFVNPDPAIKPPDDVAADPEKLDKWIKRYGTLAQQLAVEIKEAKKELGAAFTPELEKQIRAKFAERAEKAGAKKKDNQDPLGSFITDQLNAQGRRDERANEQAAQQQQQGRDMAMQAIVGQDPIAQLQYQLDQKTKLLKEAAERDMDNAELYAQAQVALEQDTWEKIRVERDRAKAQEALRMSAMLQSTSQMFDSMAGIIASFGGKQSSAYRAMFAVSKAFALADATVKLQQAIMNANFSAPWPSNFAAMASVASAGAGIISTIQSASFAGGRQYGGPVSAGSMYRVNETGKPEMFVAANGNQYMMPTQGGQVVSADKLGGGGVMVSGDTITINTQVVMNNTSATTTTATEGTGDTQAARQLGEMVTAVTKDVMVRELRPGGLLWKLKQGQV